MPAHELVIQLGVTRGVDPAEVLHSAVLMNSLRYQVSIAKHSAVLEQIGNFKVLALVLLD